jgi:hypothetical protein
MSEAPENDDVLAALRQLRQLPLRDVDRETALRVQRRAHAVMERQGGSPMVVATANGLAIVWSRWIVPAVLAAVVLAYLMWAFDAAVAFHK